MVELGGLQSRWSLLLPADFVVCHKCKLHIVALLGQSHAKTTLEIRPIICCSHEGDNCENVLRKRGMPDALSQPLVMTRLPVALLVSGIWHCYSNPSIPQLPAYPCAGVERCIMVGWRDRRGTDAVAPRVQPLPMDVAALAHDRTISSSTMLGQILRFMKNS
jgi:hypothetical protein